MIEQMMGSTIRGYSASHEVYDPDTVQVGDTFEADGQEWIVRSIHTHEVEAGCLGCVDTDHDGYRINQHGEIERCDMCGVFPSDEAAQWAVQQGLAYHEVDQHEGGEV